MQEWREGYQIGKGEVKERGSKGDWSSEEDDIIFFRGRVSRTPESANNSVKAVRGEGNVD